MTLDFMSSGAPAGLKAGDCVAEMVYGAFSEWGIVSEKLALQVPTCAPQIVALLKDGCRAGSSGPDEERGDGTRDSGGRRHRAVCGPARKSCREPRHSHLWEQVGGKAHRRFGHVGSH